MVDLICPICTAPFKRKPSEHKDVNSSYACAAKGTGNLRPPPKGARRTPKTEFKKGTTPRNKVPVGTERVRTHKGDTPRMSVRVEPVSGAPEPSSYGSGPMVRCPEGISGSPRGQGHPE